MVKVAHTEELDFLIIRAQAGDLDAFGTIVLRFQDMAVGYAYSILGDFHLAQDAAQEAFIEAYRNLTKVYGAVVFPAWFRKIIFKNCNRFTRRMNPQTVELNQAMLMSSTEGNPQEVIEDVEMRQMVLSAIRSLPEEERTVTTLFYIDGYSYNEISTFLEVPKTAIDNHLRSARKRLKNRMMTIASDVLHNEQPSKDQRFSNKVQFFNAVEDGDMDKVRELLETNSAYIALYDFIKARAKEQNMTVEELVVWLIKKYKEDVENYETLTQVFREKVKSREKQLCV
jgi:RNA polymerase sigma factor (sigma-70 family)